MIDYEEFEEIVVNVLERDISSNEDQKLAISSDMNQSLFIVAGPGSGKTTVMVLKILKFIFVDDVSPNEIVATTFTKKAASEMLSRILSWGDKIKKELIDSNEKKIGLYMNKVLEGDSGAAKELDKIKKLLNDVKKIDFNLINVGTIDSIADELLRVYRDPGTTRPILIEDFVANSVMINECLVTDDMYKHEALQEYLAEVSGKESRTDKKPRIKNLTLMAENLIKIKENIYFNMVDIDDILANVSPNERGKEIALKLISQYIDKLKSQNIYDFAMLETEFLNRLNTNAFSSFLNDIKIILVDEYQDTNLLQESIYFKIAQSAVKNGGNITVVGDDDQSLYRFRGASVELFTDFISRIGAIGIDSKEINLKTNYRSSENIIDLCNDFVELDDEYQPARVKAKPKIIFPKTANEDGDDKQIPILGMFRHNQKMLAQDLADFIDELNREGIVKRKILRVLTKEENERLNFDNKESLLDYRDSTFELAEGEDEIIIELDEESGSPEDVAFLTYSPKESTTVGVTFPFLLKKYLGQLEEPIEVFNPRGQDLQNIESVETFCGLMLECIDPNAKYQKGNDKLPLSAISKMIKWRKQAKSFMENVNPEPRKPISLERFVTHWQVRQPFSSDGSKDLKWPEKASLIALAYKLVTWIEEFQDDAEGIVYLKAITQTITQTSFFNKYSANIDFSSPEDEKASIDEALLNIFVPLATGGVSIDESYFEVIPPNRLNIMSIHQSKGLEFPLVIVDVGSRFKMNKSDQSYLRFPKKANSSSIIQDRIRQFSTLSDNERNSKDRAFDDLTRLYFVAFSRAKDVLLLVGLTPSIDGYSVKNKQMKIPNVALGWNRDEEFIGFENIYLI